MRAQRHAKYAAIPEEEHASRLAAQRVKRRAHYAAMPKEKQAKSNNKEIKKPPSYPSAGGAVQMSQAIAKKLNKRTEEEKVKKRNKRTEEENATDLRAQRRAKYAAIPEEEHASRLEARREKRRAHYAAMPKEKQAKSNNKEIKKTPSYPSAGGAA